jgi:hypothetical protein
MSNNTPELPYKFGISFNELIKSIEHAFDAVTPLLDYLEGRLDIDTIVGSDLDDLGSFVKIVRDVDQTDEQYRTRLKGWLDFPDSKPNSSSIIGLAQDIVGVTPTILEYPAFDFTWLIGRTHPAIWVKFSFTDLATYSDEIADFSLLVKNFKAAGVPLFVGGILDTLAETITNINDNSVYDIGFIFGLFESLNAEFTGWDVENWGEAVWDGNPYIRDLFIGPAPEFREILGDILIDTFLDASFTFIGGNETLSVSNEVYTLVTILNVSDIFTDITEANFLDINLNINEDPFTGTTTENITQITTVPLRVGSGTVGPDTSNAGHIVNTGDIELLTIDEDYD